MNRDECPHCGADLPPKAKACPECGSCEETGWSEDAAASALGLPDDSFDYDAFVEEEFGPKKEKKRPFAWLWACVAIGLILLFVAFWVF